MKEKTIERFKKEVYNLVKNEYLVLGRGVNTSVKIRIKHNIKECGFEYEVRPNAFTKQKGTRCPKCSGLMKKTTGQFKEEVYNLVKEEYVVLGEYINNHTKIKIRHNTCDTEYEVIPNNFLTGTRCPKCSGLMKKTTKQFKEEVYNLVEDEYSILGEYINNHTKIKIRHNTCNTEYEVMPNSFLKGVRCPKCFKNERKTTEQFKEEVYNLVKDEYSVLGEYKNANTKIKMKHNTCNTEYEVMPYSFLHKSRCPKCFRKIKKTTEQFKEEVYNLVKDEYSVLGEYKNNCTKIKIKHNKCGAEYEIIPNSFLRGSRCTKCRKQTK